MATNNELNANTHDGEELDIIELERFDTAFAVSKSLDTETKRRFMTLFVSTGETRLYGSSGTVSKAYNAKGELFALKRLRSDIAPAEEQSNGLFTQTQMKAFYEEYRTQLQLSHMKGFPKLYGYGEANGEPLILMEWVEGTTLANAKRELPAGLAPGSVDLRCVAQLGRDLFTILEALDLMAERPVHRDISPSNIMLRTSSRSVAQQVADGTFDLCLIDFGSATVVSAANPNFTMVTNVWRNGTPEYAPPEMLTLDAPGVTELRQSPSIDVYASSSILYELASGSTPFKIAEHPETSPYRRKMDYDPTPLPGSMGLAGAAIMGGLQREQRWRLQPGTIARMFTGYLNGEAATAGNYPTARNLAASSGIPPAADYETSHLSMPNARPVQAAGMVRPRQAAQHVVAPRVQPTMQPAQTAAPKPTSRRAFLIGAATVIAAAAVGGATYFLVSSQKRATDGLSSAGTATGTATANANTAETQSTNNSGSVAATATYDQNALLLAQDPSTGLWGYLSPRGDWSIEPRFEAMPGFFSAGLAWATDPSTGNVGFIGTSGAWVIRPEFDSSSSYFGPDGLAAVIGLKGNDMAGGKAGLIGWIDTSGTWAIPPLYDAGGTCAQGLAPYSPNTRSNPNPTWGYLNLEGDVAIEPSFHAVGPFSDNGLARAEESATRCGWIDTSGAWAIPATHTANATFSEGLAGVSDAPGNKWGFVDASGNETIPQRYLAVRGFHESLAAAQDDETSLWGAIDKTGSWAIEPGFLQLGDFSGGLAAAQDVKSGLFGFVSTDGNWVVEPHYLSACLAAYA